MKGNAQKEFSELGTTIAQACSTLGLSVEEAFRLIDFVPPNHNEMHLLPLTAWIKLCDLLCLPYDQVSLKYDINLHSNLIRHRKRFLVKIAHRPDGIGIEAHR